MRKVSEFLRDMREGLTWFMTVISSDHAYIHDGKGFSVNHEQVALASGAKAYLGFVTPVVDSTKASFIHWRPSGLSSTDSGVVLRIYEDLEFTVGTDADVFNRNRISTKTTNMQSFKSGVAATPTAAPNTELIVGLAGVGSGGNPVSSSGGGSGGAENEEVLKQNTSYVIELENIGAVSTTVPVNLFWYEEKKGLDPE